MLFVCLINTICTWIRFICLYLGKDESKARCWSTGQGHRESGQLAMSVIVHPHSSGHCICFKSQHICILSCIQMIFVLICNSFLITLIVECVLVLHIFVFIFVFVFVICIHICICTLILVLSVFVTLCLPKVGFSACLQSCKMSILLQGAKFSKQILPPGKCVIRNNFGY